MNFREAVKRLMCEIVLFTDRPDYCKPDSVDKAFEVISKEIGIEKDEIYRDYGKYED